MPLIPWIVTLHILTWLTTATATLLGHHLEPPLIQITIAGTILWWTDKHLQTGLMDWLGSKLKTLINENTLTLTWALIQNIPTRIINKLPNFQWGTLWANATIAEDLAHTLDNAINPTTFPTDEDEESYDEWDDEDEWDEDEDDWVWEDEDW